MSGKEILRAQLPAVPGQKKLLPAGAVFVDPMGQSRLSRAGLSGQEDGSRGGCVLACQDPGLQGRRILAEQVRDQKLPGRQTEARAFFSPAADMFRGLAADVFLGPAAGVSRGGGGQKRLGGKGAEGDEKSPDPLFYQDRVEVQGVFCALDHSQMAQD